MEKRQIIKIDRAKCTGCGLCVSACHEGAIQLVNGKAELVSESYCDGLGACIGDCPEGAISIRSARIPCCTKDGGAVLRWHCPRPYPSPKHIRSTPFREGSHDRDRRGHNH